MMQQKKHEERLKNARKAFLVAIGVPDAKASSVEFGVIFVKVIKRTQS